MTTTITNEEAKSHFAFQIDATDGSNDKFICVIVKRGTVAHYRWFDSETGRWTREEAKLADARLMWRESKDEPWFTQIDGRELDLLVDDIIEFYACRAEAMANAA